MRKAFQGFVTVLALLVASPAAAQVAWEAPLLVGPGTVGGIGFFLLEASPGDGLGAMVTWRKNRAPGNIGFRAGLAEGRGDDVAGFGGVDFSAMWFEATEDFPLDVAWVTGVGIGAGNYILLSVPLAVMVGRTLTLESAQIVPYAGPRLFLDAFLGDEAPRSDDLDLGIAVDLGFDAVLSSRFTIRFGASLGDRSALAIGLGFQQGGS